MYNGHCPSNTLSLPVCGPPCFILPVPRLHHLHGRSNSHPGIQNLSLWTSSVLLSSLIPSLLNPPLPLWGSVPSSHAQRCKAILKFRGWKTEGEGSRIGYLSKKVLRKCLVRQRPHFRTQGEKGALSCLPPMEPILPRSLPFQVKGVSWVGLSNCVEAG